ncbi:hypothetical protein [Roseococcus pinisoli]|uniref:Uncharacterized protein n=1 Tax=Roseococcus pinisoli TaxID=2835040 RepID=A0ABS5QH76_9PROT|nr:hypothetical protein [Roseococcus pinisoli]MBS7812287.1 hypothetical protein [Roseococcus pinisoli]
MIYDDKDREIVEQEIMKAFQAAKVTRPQSEWLALLKRIGDEKVRSMRGHVVQTYEANGEFNVLVLPG